MGEYMGTHPIFESDFDCLTESLISSWACLLICSAWDFSCLSSLFTGFRWWLNKKIQRKKLNDFSFYSRSILSLKIKKYTVRLIISAILKKLSVRPHLLPRQFLI